LVGARKDNLTGSLGWWQCFVVAEFKARSRGIGGMATIQQGIGESRKRDDSEDERDRSIKKPRPTAPSGPREAIPTHPPDAHLVEFSSSTQADAPQSLPPDEKHATNKVQLAGYALQMMFSGTVVNWWSPS